MESKTSEKGDILDMRREVFDKVDKTKQSLALKKTKNKQLTF
jgi:hypothetical protein